MAKEFKTGTVEIPEEDFLDENITAHISIRLPLTLVKTLKTLSLTEEYSGKYQVLIRDILTAYARENIDKPRTRSKATERLVSKVSEASKQYLTSPKKTAVTSLRSTKKSSVIK